jgi:2-hydroxychromene-2-carboxylate isomerase
MFFRAAPATVAIGDELFWGDDRLDEADPALSR